MQFTNIILSLAAMASMAFASGVPNCDAKWRCTSAISAGWGTTCGMLLSTRGLDFLS
jgi:hypothetical protein